MVGGKGKKKGGEREETNPQGERKFSVVVEGLQQTNQQVGSTDLEFKGLLGREGEEWREGRGVIVRREEKKDLGVSNLNSRTIIIVVQRLKVFFTRAQRQSQNFSETSKSTFQTKLLF